MTELGPNTHLGPNTLLSGNGASGNVLFAGGGGMKITPSPSGPTVVGPGYIPVTPAAVIRYWPEKTIHYKTYLKDALKASLQAIFLQHPDQLLQKTKVTLDTPKTNADYPAVIIRFYEGRVERTGLYNTELNRFLIDGRVSPLVRQEKFFYWGTLEWAVVAQSSYDRDLISDSVVQTIMASEMETYTNFFKTRIYTIDQGILDTNLNFININHGHLLGFGENNQQVPWMEEDELLYRTSHRTEVFGQFMTPPDVPIHYIESYAMYPYILGQPVPTGDPLDPAPWDGAVIENVTPGFLPFQS